MTNRSVRQLILIISLSSYAICLPMDSVCTTDGCSEWPAWGILLFGWATILSSIGNFTWIANPIYFIALCYFYNENINKSLLYIFLASALAILFIFCDYVLVNESGYLSKIAGVTAGYWIWVSCFFGTMISMLVYKTRVNTG